MYNYLYNSLWDNPEQYGLMFDNSGISLDGGNIEEVSVMATMPPKPKKAIIPNQTYVLPDTKIHIEPMKDSFSKQELRELDKYDRWATRVVKRNNRRAERELRQQQNIERYGNKMGMSKGVQSALSSASSALSGYAYSDNGAIEQLGQSLVGTGLTALGPAGMIANTALDTANAVAKAFGKDNKVINRSDANLLGLNNSATIGNTFVNSLKLGFLGAFGPEYKKSSYIQDIGKAGSAFSGTVAIDSALERNQGNHLFGGKGLSKVDREHAKNVNNINNIIYESKRMESNYAPQLYAANNQMIYNGYTPGLTLHKHGGTIPELEKIRSIMQSLQSKKQEIQEPQKFQLGGKMNMIVTGALHARKHNLEELNPNLEGEITKKGIPVVVMNEGGEVQNQQAEVESQELVLQIDATKTIEDYYNEYNSTDSKTEKNKVALECGKYLVDELLKNTDDPDKLIKKTV